MVRRWKVARSHRKKKCEAGFGLGGSQFQHEAPSVGCILTLTSVRSIRAGMKPPPPIATKTSGLKASAGHGA